MKNKILVAHPWNEELMTPLQQSNWPIDFMEGSTDTYDRIMEVIPDYVALLVYSQTIDAAIMDRATGLKIISKHGVGYDNVDVSYARKKGIIVANTPVGPITPTADLAMGLMLALMRNIAHTDRMIRAGNQFNWSGLNIFGSTLTHKKLGILGMGRIGKKLAKRALAFDMKVFYHNRNRLPESEEQKYQATYCSFEELLAEMDILSVHTPYKEETHHLIDTAALELMKPQAVLINTSRGKVIDEEALISALQSRKIAGAGLDVFAEEPHIPESLIHLPNVVLTPHIGSATVEDRRAMFKESMENILQYQRGEEVKNRVN